MTAAPRLSIIEDSGQTFSPFVRKWRNWQTRKPQELVAARSWRFKSSLPHINQFNDLAGVSLIGLAADQCRHFASCLQVFRPPLGSARRDATRASTCSSQRSMLRMDDTAESSMLVTTSDEGGAAWSWTMKT